jgi:short-chain Z-isoprenyl diphosphate synthase
LWLLSSDNFKRDTAELESLYQIITETVEKLRSTGRWRIKPMGSFELLPPDLRESLKDVEQSTAGNLDGIIVNVAIGYGGRLEIVDAVKRFIADSAKDGKSATQIGEAISAEKIDQFLYTAGLPDPELVIRTSGEQRLGGFLLWQSHQSEFYFCEAYWPDFRKVDFLRALRSYAVRERRLGR